MKASLLEELKQKEDKELMKLFQQGSIQAFNIIVDRWEKRLEHFIYGFTKDRQRAQDLTQDTFLKVHRNRHSYKPIAKVSTWMFTIASNMAKTEYHKKKKRGEQSIYNDYNDEEGEQLMALPDESMSPEADMANTEREERIMQAINNLNDTYHEVIILRDISQLKYEEIVEITGLPMGTVKSRINRGRKKLQKELDDVYTPVKH